jgi:TetR/AcrR family transcriptional regulator
LTTDTSPGGGSRTRRRRKHARAEELREAALSLFVEKGFDATRTEEIAARAGISKGTLYLYFPSKEKLLKEAIASPALKGLAKVRPVAERDGTSTDVLRRVLSDVWAQLQDETVGSVLKLAVAEARRFPEIMEVWLRDAVRPMRSLIADVVLQGMDCGEFRQMDPDVVAHSLLLPMFMLCLQRHVIDRGALADRCPDEGFISQHVDVVLQGLCRDS